MVKALYPGSFDPVHNGHIDIVATASRLFDEVVIAAMRNPSKAAPLFTDEERVRLLEESTAHLGNVTVVEFGERVRALAVTAGGLSNDPDSPHFNDQAERYASGDLRPVHFYPEDIEANARETYRPGRR